MVLFDFSLSVIVVQNGVHFTTPQLKSVNEKLKSLDAAYKKHQKELISKVIETALTYATVMEVASSIIAEVDVLASFAVTAVLSPQRYVKPIIYPKEAGKLYVQGGRHPCVELMDNVKFIPNEYSFEKEKCNFQIVTGPNMVRLSC